MTPKISLPAMEHEFRISVKGIRTGTLYEGTFKYRRPNLGQIRTARVMRARLGEDLQNLDSETQLMNEMLSWLSVSLIEAPAWWQNNGFDMYDLNVVEEIYTQVLQYEHSFYQKIESMGDEKNEPKESKSE